jgi:hypothetical protein
MVRRACHPRLLYTAWIHEGSREHWRHVVMNERTGALVGSCSLICRSHKDITELSAIQTEASPA